MRLDTAINYLTDMRNEYGNLELLITFEDHEGKLNRVEDFGLKEKTYSYAAGYFGVKDRELIEAIWN